MITKQQYKAEHAGRSFKIGTYEIVDKAEFEANSEEHWKMLKSKLDRKKFKNIHVVEKITEDYHGADSVFRKLADKMRKEKLPATKLFIGISASCEYRDYWGFLMEQRDKLERALKEINDVLGKR